MLTLHTTQTKTKITLLKEEFFQLIKKFKKIEPIEIIDEDPDYLSKEGRRVKNEPKAVFFFVRVGYPSVHVLKSINLQGYIEKDHFPRRISYMHISYEVYIQKSIFF